MTTRVVARSDGWATLAPVARDLRAVLFVCASGVPSRHVTLDILRVQGLELARLGQRLSSGTR